MSDVFGKKSGCDLNGRFELDGTRHLAGCGLAFTLDPTDCPQCNPKEANAKSVCLSPLTGK